MFPKAFICPKMPRSTVTVLLLQENRGTYNRVANQAAFQCQSGQELRKAQNPYQLSQYIKSSTN